MDRRSVGRAVAAFAVVVLTGGACTEDEPATELPCEFWVNQFESGGVEIDEVPEEFRDAARGEETCDEAGASERGLGVRPAWRRG